jgi:hypothetical protein
LLTETGELFAFSYSKVSGDGIPYSKEDGLTDKREKYHVVGDEDEIEPALTVSRVGRVIRWRWSGVGDEEKRGKGARGWVG